MIFFKGLESTPLNSDNSNTTSVHWARPSQDKLHPSKSLSQVSIFVYHHVNFTFRLSKRSRYQLLIGIHMSLPVSFPNDIATPTTSNAEPWSLSRADGYASQISCTCRFCLMIITANANWTGRKRLITYLSIPQLSFSLVYKPFPVAILPRTA